ncbi:DNA-binding transcriptional response regulator, NtrC family, contains REC, AAA-type ATPase, and a Fis-type DNA-binding domains [Fodinibius salinus]|uniref:DNA-binding transcriptional response regulator, NtrC family, contains REC, AAA-type ATPase, and a Fis-type DNA-binding domains n=1 Tax=Fodinibius salinus TaxID=860790 RepID=A0A5D3YNK9_9BACT|nr:sigma-54 dependent transcriptional regulator [Fodinibius salinus]TYP94938.1 DNA-binding transcriptional response regulator, NtrC family, contains REC, AAA-type ATPase, and a Fis-type DNA-binding domains [Fodinibius salinus]
MSDVTPTILVVDDEKSIRNSLRDILEFEDYSVVEASNGQKVFELLEDSIDVDLMLLDIKMKGMDGMEILTKLREQKYSFPVIMISGHGNIEIAVKATKKGAFDFIEKPPDLNRLLVSVRNALDQHRLSKENQSMKSRLPEVPEIIGESKAIQQIKSAIEKVAKTSSRVMVTGENGTGKELVARWIHKKSSRYSNPFVEVNCAAIPADLLESELFGHEEGAFTGASSQRIGKFEQADGGTLFLDEVGDMSMDAQAKVLRALEENAIIRVGGTQKISVDVRVISATNKKLLEEIEEGNFREDLYHRLNVIPIEVPPLRERREDISLLADSWLDHLAQKDIVFSGISFTEEALNELKTKQWSGNVRELQNAIERLGLLVDGSKITKKDVQDLTFTGNRGDEGIDNLVNEISEFKDFKESAERLFLIQKLEDHDWNISKTAKAIDIQRSHMYTKMKKYDINR